MGEDGVATEARSELECGICCMPYDFYEHAPRRLGGAQGSWRPSHCGHVICNACVCQLARAGWWEQVTCPYCRTVTSLREHGNLLAAGVRRRSGGWRSRLVLPSIDADLWQQVLQRERDKARRVERLAGDEDLEEEEEEQENSEGGLWDSWRALKKKREEAEAKRMREMEAGGHVTAPDPHCGVSNQSTPPIPQ